MDEIGFLTDRDFRALAEAGASAVEPFEPSFVQPASIDMRLGNVQYKYKYATYSLAQEPTDGDYELEEFEKLTIEPGKTAFVSLQEEMRIPDDCVGLVFPRSSVTRLGLIVPPVYMNPGYHGRMPITIYNSTTFPIEIQPRVRFAQLLCARLAHPPEKPYRALAGAKYATDRADPSKLHTDAEIRAALAEVMQKVFPKHVVPG